MPTITDNNRKEEIPGAGDISGLPVDPGEENPGDGSLDKESVKDIYKLISENSKLIEKLKAGKIPTDKQYKNIALNAIKVLSVADIYTKSGELGDSEFNNILMAAKNAITFLAEAKYIHEDEKVAKAIKECTDFTNKAIKNGGDYSKLKDLSKTIKSIMGNINMISTTKDNYRERNNQKFDEYVKDATHDKDGKLTVKDRSKGVKGSEVRIVAKPNINAGFLSVLESPSTSAKTIATIKKNAKDLHITKKTEKGDWYYVAEYGGWIRSKYVDVTSRVTTAKQMEKEKKEEAKKKKKKLEKKKKKIESNQIEKYLYTIDTATGKKVKTKYNKKSSIVDERFVKNISTKKVNGIWGMPYQFLATVDRRVLEEPERMQTDNKWVGYGKTYTDRIIARMPLLLISPGRVNFTRDYMDKDKAAQAITGLLTGAKDLLTDLADSVNHNTRYYTFETDYVDYYNCVNTMISSGAKYMELHNVQVKLGPKTKKLGSINWIDVANPSASEFAEFKNILSSRQYVAFYIDSTNQISESFSNDTTESMLSSSVNSASSVGREISFILGAATGKVPKFWDENEVANTMTRVEEIGDKYLKGNQLFKDIGNQFATIAVGGKLIFPEIWSDSSFSKTYNITIKLRTPDGDKLSWFLNIYVPLCHLICLTAPIQSPHGVNGIVSPFLVKAFYRGLFNVEMGIVTSLNITKGKEGAWTIDGLPTEVDIDMEIKDLYTLMSINKENSPGSIVNNICLMDYIANTVGININEPDFIRQLDFYAMLTVNKYKHAIPNVWNIVQQDAYNKINDYYTKMTKFLR